ncbi:hypothetical protein C8R45DRAFT_909855 [Mycena sanguinolenta]|nr:hypothetical protein C8R45DRAFT_909855 [Mycena sanguinolenta]
MSSADIHVNVACLQAQTEALQRGSLQFMLTLVQLALNVDCLQQDQAKKGLPKITYEAIADSYSTGKVKRRTFINWVGYGRRLLVLCGAGSMYILPIIAVLNMRSKIIGEASTLADILSLANALQRVRHGMWLPMIRRLMLPINYLCLRNCFQHLQLKYNVPTGLNEEPKVIDIGFSDMDALDGYFDNVETNAYRLPARSSEWNIPSRIAWCRLTDPKDVRLPPLRKLKTPLKLKKTSCPVSKSNWDAFTDMQREYAEKASYAASIEDLQEKVKVLHAGGKTKPNTYVGINSSILNGEALYIADSEDQFLALLFSVPEEYREMLRMAVERIHAVMPGEFKDDDSRAKFFRYIAFHYVWYGKFAEKGNGAPESLHPDDIRKDHGGRCNHEQRLPRLAKDCLKNPDDYALLADAFADFFELIRIVLKEYLPAEYDEIKIFAKALPLGASSPTYPFSGFVLNISACTWAHRDGDKVMCFVIPLGDFQGGELGLYETGFLFDLKMGDVLAFPSCNLTHFNCHFKGCRATLVLHTDPKGDSWVHSCNGWGAHVVRHGSQKSQ